jgi:hypothetical protein
MTTGGWIIMVVSVSFVTLLFAWCIYKVFTTPQAEQHIHGAKEIAPPDSAED